MAQTDLQTVKDSLPPEAASAGWDDAKIADLLAAGVSPSRTVLGWWRQRAAQLVNMVDVSESGSSRSLSSTYKQTKEMLDYWEARVKDEETFTPDEEAPRTIAFRSARRV